MSAVLEYGARTGRMKCSEPNLSRLTYDEPQGPAMFFISQADNGVWQIVQEPFRRLEVTRLLESGRRVLLAHTGDEQYEPSLNVVTECYPATNTGTGPRWVVTVLAEASGVPISDLMRQVPLSPYLVTAK